MGAGPVSGPDSSAKPAAASASWGLCEPHDTATQGLVVSGFVKLPHAAALFLEVGARPPDAPAGSWIGALDGGLAPITDSDGPDPRAAALAFTASGLAAIKTPPEVRESFAPPFKEGMFQLDRLRRLGDYDPDGAWTDSVIPGGPVWSGNTCPPAIAPPAKFDPALPPPDNFVSTPTTVHALLLLYEATPDAVAAWVGTVTAGLAPYGVRVAHRLELELRLDEHGVGREHFGFADGISQPVPYSVPCEAGTGDVNAVVVGGAPAQRDPWHGVPLGEMLFGHTNAHHEKAPGPLVADDAPGAEAAGLRRDAAPEGFLNLGLDGSYMVVRELRQDTAAFWRSIREGAARIRTRDPSATHVTPDWLAERIVGRSRDGHLLCPGGKVLPPDENGAPQNAFGFKSMDPHGIGCPAGSHTRRANPRDGLAKDLAAAETMLDSANSHRILRRGRKYGPTAEDPAVPDDAERGLLFICLNTDIARQFEFVQQNWILNCNFATLFDESDPLIGPKGRFTIPEDPLRRIVDVETFVRMAGGEYFFLPSLPALRYLAAL